MSWRLLGWGIQGDAELDLDVPAGDADLLDDEAEELLSLVEVKVIKGGQGAAGEVGDALTQLVVGGQLGPLCGQLLASGVQLGVSAVDVFGAALHVDEFDQSGLVEVNQAATFLGRGHDLAIEAGELGGEQLVVAGRLGWWPARFDRPGARRGG